MGKTTIEWTDETWNPTTGCREVSPGCKNCYARRIFKRPYPKREFHDVQCHPERLDAPLHWRKPRRVFVNSMSDLFHEAVPDEFIDAVFMAMICAPQHHFQILTKRPLRMGAYLTTPLRLENIYMQRYGISGSPLDAEDWPLPNVHLGVSIEDQPTADERIPILLETPAAVRFISYEPALGPVDLQHLQPGDPPVEIAALNGTHGVLRPHRGVSPKLDWVIAGGESGPRARPPHPDWFRSLRDQCAAAGAPFFFKQWGEWIPRKLYEESGKGKNYPWGVINLDGDWFDQTTAWNGREGKDSSTREYTMLRVGKKTAGALLDGREHKEFPGQPSAPSSAQRVSRGEQSESDSMAGE
jgi:protein gp37